MIASGEGLKFPCEKTQRSARQSRYSASSPRSPTGSNHDRIGKQNDLAWTSRRLYLGTRAYAPRQSLLGSEARPGSSESAVYSRRGSRPCSAAVSVGDWTRISVRLAPIDSTSLRRSDLVTRWFALALPRLGIGLSALWAVFNMTVLGQFVIDPDPEHLAAAVTLAVSVAASIALAGYGTTSLARAPKLSTGTLALVGIGLLWSLASLFAGVVASLAEIAYAGSWRFAVLVYPVPSFLIGVGTVRACARRGIRVNRSGNAGGSSSEQNEPREDTLDE